MPSNTGNSPPPPPSSESHASQPTTSASLTFPNLSPSNSISRSAASAPASPLPRVDGTPTPLVPSEHGRGNPPMLPEGRLPLVPVNQGWNSVGLLSPNSSGSTASFVFPVRSMFANMGGQPGQQPPLARNNSGGAPPLPSSPTSMRNNRATFGGPGIDRDRADSISSTASGGLSIGSVLSQGEALSQMLTEASKLSISEQQKQHQGRSISSSSTDLRRMSSQRAPKLSPVLSDGPAEMAGSSSGSDTTNLAIARPKDLARVREQTMGAMTAPLTDVRETSESPFFTGLGEFPGGSVQSTLEKSPGLGSRERRMSVPPSKTMEIQLYKESTMSQTASPNPMSGATATFHGFHDPNTYILAPDHLTRPPLPPQRHSSYQRRTTSQLKPSPLDEPAASEPHAAGQIDPVDPQEFSIQQATTERVKDHDGHATYTFRDRPGARDAEEAKSKPQVEITAPQPSSEGDADGLGHSGRAADPQRAPARAGGKQPTGLHVGGGHVWRERSDQDETEPAVGAALDGVGAGGETRDFEDPEDAHSIGPDTPGSAPSNMQGIVRLGPAQEAGDYLSAGYDNGSGRGGGGSGSTGSDKLIQVQSLKRSMRETVDHQSSVQKFVNNQADTETMKDPNAAAPTAGSGNPPTREDMTPSYNSRPASKSVYSDASKGPSASQSASQAGDDDTESTDPEATGSLQVSGNSSRDSSDLTASREESEPVMTVRFEHITTSDGHHVVVGREGKLEKCEDEPITTPGAVQGFGVLLVLEENEETGDLGVRQVSENCTELLGLSPRYLFRLQCFSHILPRSQDDTLRDNIDYLPDPDYQGNDGDDNDGPQVFLLSGYGEPGSDDTDDTPSARTVNRRREWTCWVAAHRPSQKSWNRVDKRGRPDPPPNLIVLEFELEGDPYNPLYPPMNVAEPSGAESPASGSGVATSGSEAAFSQAQSRETDSSGQNTNASGRDSGQSTATDSTINGGLSSGTQTTDADGRGQRLMGLEGTEVYIDPADILESTTSRARPLRALERMRRMTRTALITGAGGADYTGQANIGADPTASGGRRRTRRDGAGAGGVGTMDVFAVLAQINDQLGTAPDLETFLKIVVGVIKDLTQFHRCLVYSFDAHWNGQVVAELVDWSKTHDLYKGLMFPMTDIPAQARDLYRISSWPDLVLLVRIWLMRQFTPLDKVRLLYDREQPTARMVMRNKEDLEFPIDMTHSYLRAMSPIHLVYLRNMGVRSSMSVSIMAFGSLWGLIACHGYGDAGMRVSFPVRQMLKLLSDSISRNIERLSYAARLHSRKLISTIPTDSHPTGYIVSNADDLIQLFDADSGVLVIGDGAKILGPTSEHGQEILLIAEFLRLKRYEQMQVSHNILDDFPELRGPRAPETISGLLYVPLSSGGRDYICFLRKGQAREVNWAGKPYKEGKEAGANLEPRQSFKVWSETIQGRARNWTDEQMETAGVLALVYGKFIEVWRQKESAIRTNQMTAILLTNASHEVRTPLNHIINYLELALDGHLDNETRENLSRSHVASKSLLFTINDLLDLTRIESGNETAFNDPFDLRHCVEEATNVYRSEATRKGLDFVVNTGDAPEHLVVGDRKKIRTMVANLVANAVKYTASGVVQIVCRAKESTASSVSNSIASAGTGGRFTDIEIIISDTGAGIPSEKLEAMFVTFEQAESASTQPGGLGLGLAVVARIVEQLGGQLRAESDIGVGTRFYVIIQMARHMPDEDSGSNASRPGSALQRIRGPHSDSGGSAVSTSNRSHSTEIDTFVEAFGQSHMPRGDGVEERKASAEARMSQPGTFPVTDSSWPVRARKIDVDDALTPKSKSNSSGGSLIAKPLSERVSPELIVASSVAKSQSSSRPGKSPQKPKSLSSPVKLRILVVEDDEVNRKILERRLRIDGHTVLSDTNGQEAVDRIMKDQNFDCILMDIQMPVMDGRQSAEAIRNFQDKLKKNLSSEVTLRRIDGHIPIIAVSATLLETQQEDLRRHFDGWMLKPVDFKRMLQLLSGLSSIARRKQDVYRKGGWEKGGWLNAVLEDESRRLSSSTDQLTPKLA